MVGSSDVVGNVDYHAALGTKVIWSDTTVVSAHDTCQIVHPTLTAIPNDDLEHGIWGGQTISGLILPKKVIRAAFGKANTLVYDGGGIGCVDAVMLDINHMVFGFGNGYLYMLTRTK